MDYMCRFFEDIRQKRQIYELQLTLVVSNPIKRHVLTVHGFL